MDMGAGSTALAEVIDMPTSPSTPGDSLERRQHIFSHSVQFSSEAQSCPTLCDSMNRSTPGLPAHHQLQEFTQTHVHRPNDAIQPSDPL